MERSVGEMVGSLGMEKVGGAPGVRVAVGGIGSGVDSAHFEKSRHEVRKRSVRLEMR